MAFFKVDHDKASEGGLVTEGEYEVVVFKAFEDAAKSGTQFINLHLIIRNDIEQKHKNQWLFGSIWQSKATGEYHQGMLNGVARALQIENGKTFNTLDELVGEFVGKTARVTVKHEEYNGKTNARIQRWDPTKINGCNHEYKKNPSEDLAGFSTVSNDDIPF